MTNEHELSFTFSGDVFGLSIPEVIQIYFEVLSGTSVKPHIQEAMLPLWLEGCLRGDYRLEVAAFGPLLTEGISFKWPWFDYYRAKFKAADEWPYAWENFIDRAVDGRLGLRAERVPLLAQTLSGKCYNVAMAKNHTPSSVLARKGWEVTSEHDMKMSLYAEIASKVVLGNHRTYPPFFPGDRSDIRYSPK